MNQLERLRSCETYTINVISIIIIVFIGPHSLNENDQIIHRDCKKLDATHQFSGVTLGRVLRNFDAYQLARVDLGSYQAQRRCAYFAKLTT